MKPERVPKRNHMEEYNSAIKEQDKLLDTIHKFQWDNASTHTKAEAQAAKQMRDNVLAYKKKLEHDKVNANPADAFAYAKGTGGVSDYNKGMQHAMGNIGDGLKAEQARKAASYSKGMSHALGGSEKVNTPNMASEDSGSRNEYYDEMINRAADDYLNEWGGKDTAEAKVAWAAYGEQVDGIVEQRDAYNRAAMGVDSSAGDEQAPGENDKPITPTQGILNDMFNAGGEGLEGSGEGEFVHGTSFFSSGEKPTPENAYGQYTGGVQGNYKPPALREAEQAVTAFDIAFNKIVELTGESDQAAIMANIADNSRGIDGAIDENLDWGKAALWLLEAEEQTGMTLEEAENFLYDEEERFGNQQNYGQAIKNADIHEYVNIMVEQLTGGDSIEAMDIIKEQLGRTGTLTGTWADAYELMQKAEEMTGVSYGDAMSEKWRIEGYFKDEDMVSEIVPSEELNQIAGIKTLLDAGLINGQEAADSMEEMGITPERMGLLEQLGEFDSSSSLAMQLDDEQKAREPSDEEKDVMLDQVIDHVGDDYITEIIQNAYGEGERPDLSNIEIRGFDVVRLTDEEARDLYKQEKVESDKKLWGAGIAVSLVTFPLSWMVTLGGLVATGAAQYFANEQYANDDEPKGGFYYEYDIVIKNPDGSNDYIQGRIAPDGNNPLDFTDYFTDY